MTVNLSLAAAKEYVADVISQWGKDYCVMSADSRQTDEGIPVVDVLVDCPNGEGIFTVWQDGAELYGEM